MAQPQLSAIAMELADFVATSRANSPFARAFDRDYDLASTIFGFQDADFRQIQGNFDIRWHCFTPQYGVVGGMCHGSFRFQRPQDKEGATRVHGKPKYKA
jgi:hypothetical protein